MILRFLSTLRLYLNSQAQLNIEKKMKTIHDSDNELSQLTKHRLQSVASTESSTSSGFIEDKSYSDSDEEEESNRRLLGRVGMYK